MASILLVDGFIRGVWFSFRCVSDRKGRCYLLPSVSFNGSSGPIPSIAVFVLVNVQTGSETTFVQHSVSIFLTRCGVTGVTSY